MIDYEALVAFLLDQFEVDERALDAPGFIEDTNSARGPGWGNRGDCPLCGAYQFDGTEPVTEEAWYEHAEQAHQRSKVLADLGAKRALVRLAVEDLENDAQGSVSGTTRSFNAGAAHAARNLLHYFSLPYADRPGYNEGWKP